MIYIPHALISKITEREDNRKGAELKEKSIPFSAFWLRSSVVSVLISLISDTWFIEPHDIKCIFLGGGSTYNSLLLGLSGVACALHYSTSLAHPNNTQHKTKQQRGGNCGCVSMELVVYKLLVQFVGVN